MPENLIGAVQAALTPVVLISAAAILAGGVSQKHADLGGRIRTLMSELRKPHLAEARRQNLRAQLELFRKRTRYAQRAHLCLYGSVLPFVTMMAVLLFGASPRVAVVLLFVGVALLTGAIVSEIRELSLAGRSIELAMEDDTPSE
jgi:hypothetical protein